jgi:predicted transcriptional regulator
MMITGRQLRAARALIGIEQVELAKHADISIGTIRRMEAFDDAPIGCTVATLVRITAVLEQRGVIFIDRGVRMTAGLGIATE